MPRSDSPQTGPPRRKSRARLAAEGQGAHIPPLGGSRKAAAQARSRETVSAILEAAACLLEEQDFRSASTNAIARRAGVSIGSLYQFFASREDVFRALLARHTAEVHGRARGALEPVFSGKKAPAKVLPGLLRDLIRLHHGRPALMQAMSTQLAHLATAEDRRREAGEMAEMVERMASVLAGRPERARAKAWMAGEITAHFARCLAHEPPECVRLEAILAAYRDLMEHLLG